MPAGQPEAPINDLHDPVVLDAGTLALTESPANGPIGLDADAGIPQSTDKARGDQIAGYARGRMGASDGDGQCFALADNALKNAKAKSAADFGKITPNADYVWGSEVTLSQLQPGDIIQFRNYRYDRTIVTKTSDETRTDTNFETRPHHTAIVESVGTDGALVVLEQNAPEGSPVQRSTLFFASGTTTAGNQTTTIKIQGRFRFYRPQAR
jgi:hypothetical protein